MYQGLNECTCILYVHLHTHTNTLDVKFPLLHQVSASWFGQARLHRHVCTGTFAQACLSRHVCPGSSPHQVRTGSSDQSFTCSFTRKQPRGFETSSFGRRPQKMIVSVPVIINKKHIVLCLS